MNWPLSRIAGAALIADDLSASAAVGTSPAVWVWPNVRNGNPDLQYDPTTGVLTFKEDGFFTSVAAWHITGSTSRMFFADAEFIPPDGSVWTRGTNSMRQEQANNTSRTVSFPFAGWYAKGTRLRFVVWADGSGVTASTVSDSGSTCAAARLTTSFIVGSKVIWP